MATGKMDIHGVITMMGDAARMRDQDKAREKLETIRDMMVLEDAMDAVFEPYRAIERRVNSNLGYLTGYMPQEYGNTVLQLLDVEHPVFGKNLDVTADQALAAGMRLAEQLREQKIAEERRAKIAAKRAAGLDIPDSDQPVSSDDAKKLLEALRAKKAGVVLTPITDEESKYAGHEVKEREVKKNALEKVLGIKTEAELEIERLKAEAAAKAAEYEECEPDEYFDLENAEPDPEPVVVADPAKEAAERARLLAEIDDAGAF